MAALFTTPVTGASLRRLSTVAVALVLALSITGLSTPLGPAVPVALVLGVAGTLLVLGSTWHGLLATVVVVTLIPLPFSIRFGPVTVSFGRFLLFGLVVGFIAHATRKDTPLEVRRTPVDLTLLALLATMAAAVIVNLPRFIPVELTGAIRESGIYVVDFAAVFVVTTSVLTSTDRIVGLFRLLAHLGVLVAALGIVEYLTGRNIFEFLAPALPGGLASFVRQLAEAAVLTRGFVARTRATFEHPLAFGTVLLMTFPMVVVLAAHARDRLVRRYWAAGGAVIGASLLFTAARSVYALAATSVVLLLLLLPGGRARRALLVGGCAVVALFLAQPAVRATMIAFFDPARGGVVEGSINARIIDYRPVLELWADRPFLGYGPRSFARDELVKSGLLEDPGNLILDNAYLQHVAENGLLGLLALLALLALAATAAWRSFRAAPTPELRLLSLGLFVSVVNWIAMGFVADTYTFNAPPRLFFVLLGLVAAVRLRSGWSPREPSPVPPGTDD